MDSIIDQGIQRSERRLTHRLRLRKLQARIAPPVRAIDRKQSDVTLEITGRTRRTADVFRRYLNVCLEDAQLAAVVHGYALNAPALHRIYIRLISADLDQWKRGQHLALSCIALPETLLFIARARERRRSWEEIATALRLYFSNEFSSSELLATA